MIRGYERVLPCVIEHIVGKNHCPAIGTHKWNYQTVARSMASPTE
ncbi:hypothetical protein [Trichodesmium erythraeum]